MVRIITKSPSSRRLVDKSVKVMVDRAKSVAERLGISANKILESSHGKLDLKQIGRRVKSLESMVAEAPSHLKTYGRKLIQQTKERIGGDSMGNPVKDIKGYPVERKAINNYLSDDLLTSEWDDFVYRMMRKLGK